MKVLYFHQYFSTPSGAAGTRSYEMARRLVMRGHQVLMVCGSAERGQTGLDTPFVNGSRRGMTAGEIEVLEFDLGYSNRDGFAKRTVAFVRYAVQSVLVALREPCDLVFATSTPLTAGIPGICARGIRGRRFVFEVRDLWPELPRAMGVIRNPLVLWAMSVLEWLNYHSADRIIGLAPGIVAGITRRGIDQKIVDLIPNGCDLELFSAPAQPWRPDEVANGDLMAVFAGAHGLANGLDAVLDAAIVLKSRGRDNIKIVLAGEGKLKSRLQARALGEGLVNVVFLAPVSKTRLAGLMAASDVGMQILANVPAFYDGTSPNKFFDYLASGLPVLINYPGWLSDLVCQVGCGYAVRPDDPQAFADALVHACDHRAELKDMGQRAREIAVRQFDRALLSGRFVDCLERAVS